MGLYRAIATVGGWTMASRVLGFLRDAGMAAIMGSGPAAEAFVVAFRLPNLFRRLFAEGALSAAFVPLYAGLREKQGPEAADRFAADAIALLAIFMLWLSLLAMAFMPAVVLVLAPGFADQAELFALTVSLSIITFPYLMFMALTAVLSGMLNSWDKFASAAAAPILLNAILLAGLFAAWLGWIEAPEYGQAWAVFIAGVVQFVMVARSCHRLGILPRLGVPRLTAEMKRFLLLMLPGVIGAGVVQINIVVGTQIASFLEAGTIAWLYYADRLVQLPLGVIGVAVGVALLPTLARRIKAGDTVQALADQNRALEFALLFTLPATVALIAIPLPIVDVLFRRGAFDLADTMATADILAAYALGLPAYVLVKSLSPGFFAREDTATPVKVAGVAVVVNIALALALMGPLGAIGIALASSLAAWANVLLLAWILLRRGGLKPDARLKRRCAGILGASALMGAVLIGLVQVLPEFASLPLAGRLGVLLGLVLGGALVFLLAARLCGAIVPAELADLLRRRRG